MDKWKKLDDEEGWKEETEEVIDFFWKPWLTDKDIEEMKKRGKDTDNILHEKQELKGFFVERQQIEGEDGAFTTIVLETRDGIVSFIESDVIQRRLKNIKKGDGVYIKHLGLKPSKRHKSRKYRDYLIKTKKISKNIDDVNETETETVDPIYAIQSRITDSLIDDGILPNEKTILERAVEWFREGKITEEEGKKLKERIERKG